MTCESSECQAAREYSLIRPPTWPEPTSPTANLNGASLSGADLSGANLNKADLTGASLSGATVTGTNFNKVTWSNTPCPDGSNSNADGGTCTGHL